VLWRLHVRAGCLRGSPVGLRCAALWQQWLNGGCAAGRLGSQAAGSDPTHLLAPWSMFSWQLLQEYRATPCGPDHRRRVSC
jgi:hypothetical protein